MTPHTTQTEHWKFTVWKRWQSESLDLETPGTVEGRGALLKRRVHGLTYWMLRSPTLFIFYISMSSFSFFFFLRIITSQYCVVSTIHPHDSGRFFTSWATMEALNQPQVCICPLPPDCPFPSPSPSHLSKLSQSTVLSSHVTQQIPTCYLFYIW